MEKHKVQSQAKGQPQLHLRQLSVPELVSRAIYLRRKSGKTSRRVTVFLRAYEIPPESGTYETALGTITIRSMFKSAEGRWVCVIKLPPQEGFKLGDYIAKQSPSSSPPSPSQTKPAQQPPETDPEGYVDFTLTEEELKETERFVSQLKAQLE